MTSGAAGVSTCGCHTRRRFVREASPVLADLIAQNQLRIVAAYYELSTGAVTVL